MNIDNSEDIMDSRDFIERIEELEAEIGDFCGNTDDHDALVAELDILKAFAEEASGYCTDWSFGTTIIRDSYFQDYAEEMAKDCAGSKEERDLMDGGDHWPFTFMSIDWEAAAAALKQDYAEVDFDGVGYWVWAY